SLRMYIEHPEVARFIFQLLLNGRPLMRLGERITVTIDALKRMQPEHAPHSGYDAAFAFIILVLAQLSWAFSREELARLLGMSVEEADERFVACMRRETEQGIAAITGQAH
ncbi:MAG: hypothetical protein Q8S13_10125, partial [Dehalococcoidia bacterium]|nr:hypothetical protein [Dehalococcoidia bacterium]